jgi:flavin reductase (DIM6/NTAB) family NADH-FMN oxidoreductase RutF
VKRDPIPLEAPGIALDTGLRLKEAMASFATGVTIATARHLGEDYGMTCNSFNTVSLEPAMVLWSIRKNSGSHTAFVSGGGFAINVLAAHQKGLALQFTRGTQQERFHGVATDRTDTQRVRIHEAVAWFDCELVQAVSAGDHDILIGRVLAFDRRDADGLVYSRRQFGVLQPLANDKSL